MKLAVVRIRGDFDVVSGKCDTLTMLGLKQKNHCAVVEDTPIIKGMLRTAESLITWGPVDEKTLTALKKKSGKIFRLNPPRKGYGRKGVKIPFRMGGAYGDRKEKINDLLTRMM